MNNKMMNLKQQISKFRSEILIGKYPSAIHLAKHLLSNIDLMQSLGIGNYSTVREQIQVEYEKCLAIYSMLQGQGIKEEQSVKKWNDKGALGRTGKWGRKEESSPKEHEGMLSPIGHKEQPTLKEELQPQLNLFTSPVRKQQEQHHDFIDKIQKQVLLPLRMPAFFSNKPSRIQLIRTEKSLYGRVVEYFLENGFDRIRMQLLDGIRQEQGRELIVQCRQEQLSQIDAASRRGQGHHCVFIIQSDRNTFQQL